MKVIAMYLPQFHRVKENDEWWGTGFTEWTGVRSAEKLFPEHEQPHVPLNENYYDLMKPETMQWQADLMNRYGIDGMCFYHYYFKDGRKILEKPAENLLKWQDIDMPFCFSWANESWVRSWSRLSEQEGNPWSAKFDMQRVDETDDGILLLQEYGGEKEWKSHYEYLSPFFHDERYICKNGCPVFLIYKPDNISCLAEMLEYWRKLAKEDGFPGLYVIGTNVREAKQKGLSNSMLQEPQDSIARWYPQNFENDDHVMKSIPYNEIWQRIIDKPVEAGQCLGGFSGYDDSPRRGHGAVVVKGRKPEVFEQKMYELLMKAEQNGSPFIFLNAWNEWGEGMYLEPDEAYGYKFLEALYRAKNRMSHNREHRPKPIMNNGVIATLQEENYALHATCDRYRGYWQIMDQWLRLLETGKSIADWLRENGYKNFAVYGYGMLGKHLMHQIEQENMKPDYIIDQNREKNSGDVPMKTLEDKLPPTDLIIVTVQYDFFSIREKLKKQVETDIHSLGWLIEKILNE